MADLTSADRIRSRLGEVIPPGGTAEDTLFSDLEIRDLLDRNSDDVDKCMVEGWEIKAAKLANLVNITEGDQSRSLSQAHGQALKMLESARAHGSGPTVPATRIGKINRGGFQG